MYLHSIEIQQLRNIQHERLQFDPTLNLIVGPNASGKTSLLEAISLLAMGRSFRSPRIDELQAHHQSYLLVVGQIQHNGSITRIGLLREGRKTQVKKDGQRIARTTDMLGQVPLHVMTPESHEILDKGPKLRRRYLDWGVFHVKPAYLTCWQRYHRVLRQRNNSLRNREPRSQIQAWDRPLVQEAEQLHQFRTDYLSAVTPALTHYGQTLLDTDLQFAYRPGWECERGALSEQLLSTLQQDLERGYTRLGPHRADLSIRTANKPVLNVFSRGQQKLLVCAMTLAQATRDDKPGLILVDDLPAELDPIRRGRLMAALQETGAQVFVTATEQGLISPEGWSSHKVFHVEHGKFTEMV